MKTRLFVVCVALVLFVAACESEATSTPAPANTSAPEPQPTEAPEPTAPSLSIDTPEPTEPPPPTEISPPTDTPEPTETPELQPLYLGDVYEQDGYLFSALTVVDPATAGSLYASKSGKKLVAVEIIVGNASNDLLGVNPLDIMLIDNEGLTYGVELGGVDGQIATIELGPGEKIKGWVAFKIPEGAIAASLEFAIDFLGDDVIKADLTSPPTGYEPNTDALAIMPPRPEAKLGETYEDYGYSLTATAIEDPTTVSMFSTPIKGFKMVAVEIVVGNIAGELLSVNPLYAVLVDNDGYVYPVELGGRDGGQINLAKLDVGEKVKGWVAFLIPEDASPSIIKYAVDIFPSKFLRADLTE